MSKTDQFWQYANEAMLLASTPEPMMTNSISLSLRKTWTQAALQERAAASNHGHGQNGAE